MRAIKSINHNAALCVDSFGREVVVLGPGVGFGDLPRDIPLSQITQTFVGIDAKYLALIGELPAKELAFAGQLADVVRAQLSYELSPNLPVTLADHIVFVLERARKHLYVKMPLAYDIVQNYPVEYRLGQMAVRGIERSFGVRLPKNEATGIAMSIVNSAVASSAHAARRDQRVERMVERAVRVIERAMHVSVDRESFDYARFATHVRYLINRLDEGTPIDTQNASLYAEALEQYPEVAACTKEVARMLSQQLGSEVTAEERLYLMLHVNRLYERAKEA